MIYEYALEPELVATWHSREDFRFFVDKFGLGRGRIVSRYPRHWAKLVWESCTPRAGDMARKRLEELLMRFTERMIRRAGTHYDGSISWLLNAETEHSRQPFHAILARANPRLREHVLIPDDIDRGAERWIVRTDCVVTRTAVALAAAIHSVMSCCSTVIFIDPHFSPDKIRYRRSLREFLRSLVAKRSGSLLRVELHTGDESSVQFFRENCDNKLKPIVPTGLTLLLKRWRMKPGSEALHHRYVLTDLGGIGFKYGLDDDDGAGGQTDELNLLSVEVYRLRWEQYLGDRPAFELVDEYTIVGEGQP
jgi:hypothetical protein